MWVCGCVGVGVGVGVGVVGGGGGCTPNPNPSLPTRASSNDQINCLSGNDIGSVVRSDNRWPCRLVIIY